MIISIILFILRVLNNLMCYTGKTRFVFTYSSSANKLTGKLKTTLPKLADSQKDGVRSMKKESYFTVCPSQHKTRSNNNKSRADDIVLFLEYYVL